ncbi:MAG: hypothetical protein LAN71_01865 [Acidobacteriia bacterium]|nr:hypothetical protein [Terriglobia bacterium]
MPETFLTFDFATGEETAQQARHKLETWKQAFRLDKKLRFAFDRGEPLAEPAAAPAASKGKPKKEEKAPASGPVKLLVRLYFSDHEKMTGQRWIQRIPQEEPFKAASPQVIPAGAPEFAATQQRFEALATDRPKW